MGKTNNEWFCSEIIYDNKTSLHTLPEVWGYQRGRQKCKSKQERQSNCQQKD